MTKLSQEIATSDQVMRTELPARFVKPTHANVLVDTAKRLQRLQSRAAKLRKDLKHVTEQIKTAKRELKALTSAISAGRS
jgi:TolA-binding protein